MFLCITILFKIECKNSIISISPKTVFSIHQQKFSYKISDRSQLLWQNWNISQFPAKSRQHYMYDAELTYSDYIGFCSDHLFLVSIQLALFLFLDCLAWDFTFFFGRFFSFRFLVCSLGDTGFRSSSLSEEKTSLADPSSSAGASLIDPSSSSELSTKSSTMSSSKATTSCCVILLFFFFFSSLGGLSLKTNSF